MADQTLTIEITTGHCLGGEGNDVYPGQVLVAPQDLSIAEARKKVRMGYARVIPNAPGAVASPAAGSGSTEAPGPAVITHQEPALESRDPVIEEAPEAARRGRSRTGGR
jgi:hypothetical protein